MEEEAWIDRVLFKPITVELLIAALEEGGEKMSVWRTLSVRLFSLLFGA